MSKIVDVYWFTSATIMAPNNNIGIVKVYDENINRFKYYIGCGRWGDEKADANYIKDFGAPIHPEIFLEAIR